MKKNTIAIGQQYHLNGCGNYLLATPDGESVCLIHIASGNRFANPVQVKDRLDISKKELAQICRNVEAKKINS